MQGFATCSSQITPQSRLLYNPDCPYCHTKNMRKDGGWYRNKQRYKCRNKNCLRVSYNPLIFSCSPWYFLFNHLKGAVNLFLEQPEANLSQEIVKLIDAVNYCEEVVDNNVEAANESDINGECA